MSTTKTFYVGTTQTNVSLDEETLQLRELLGTVGVLNFDSPSEMQEVIRAGASVRVVSLTVELGDVLSNLEGTEGDEA